MYVPAAQIVQFAAPAGDEKPAPHAVHELDAIGAKVPGAHVSHAHQPAAEYWPAGHIRHDV